MKSNYSIFFIIEVNHEYFINNKCEELEIVPTEDCKEISRKMNILWRFLGNRLIGLIRENDVHEPFMNIPPAKVFRKYYDKSIFRFYVRLKNPLFLNFTNINYSYDSGQKFYFSNLSSNKQNSLLYLTLPIEDYSLGRTYLPGAMVKDGGTGNIFEAITKNSSKKKSILSDTLSWVPKGILHLSKPIQEFSTSKLYLPGDLALRPHTSEVFEAITKHVGRNENELEDPLIWSARGNGQLQYITDNDTIEGCSANYLFKVAAPIPKAEIGVSGFNYNAANPSYDVPVKEMEVRNFREPATNIAVSLSSLSRGKYEITINKEKRRVYYDPILSRGDILGVIEIFNHLPGTDSYALLDEDEKIKSIVYRIQFANRRVLWRYKPKDGKAESITDIGDTGYAFKLNGNAFVSTTPIPLSESVLKTLKLDFNTKDFSLFPLPNPGFQHLGKCSQKDYDYLCSDIYLNY
jgi:hypothetical protein